MEEIRILLQNTVDSLTKEVEAAFSEAHEKMSQLKKAKQALRALDPDAEIVTPLTRKPRTRKVNGTISLCLEFGKGRGIFTTREISDAIIEAGRRPDMTRKEVVKYVSQALGANKHLFSQHEKIGKEFRYSIIPATE